MSGWANWSRRLAILAGVGLGAALVAGTARPARAQARVGAEAAPTSLSVIAVPEGAVPGLEAARLLGAWPAGKSVQLRFLDQEGKVVAARSLDRKEAVGAVHLARDPVRGDDDTAPPMGYVGLIEADTLVVLALTDKDEREVVRHKLDAGRAELSGLAVYDGLMMAALPKAGQLVVIDAHKGEVIGRVACSEVRGVAYDQRDRLMAVSGRKVLRTERFWAGGVLRHRAPLTQLPPLQRFVSEGLDDPRHVGVNQQGHILVTDAGPAPRVRLFSPDGEPMGGFGGQGDAGQRLTAPGALAITPDGRAWVTELTGQGARLSVWSPQGSRLRTIDPMAGGRE